MTAPESVDVVCPACGHGVATLAKGTPVRAVPDNCPRCGAAIRKDRIASQPQQADPRRSMPSDGRDPRRSMPSDGRRSKPL